MVFERNQIINQFPWLMDKDRCMIISADYDGLICASFLHHHLNWSLEGYYDLSSIWISDKGIAKKNDLIWVDLNILPKQGKAIGGHIVTLSDNIPKGFDSSCNPNILAGINASRFNSKFPYSTLIYLLWIHGVEIKKKLLARLLVLHSDSTWLKFQHYTNNCKNWQKIMDGYNWNWLFQRVNTKKYETLIDQELYPLLHSLRAMSGNSKLRSKYLHINSRQLQFNPDWDEDVVLYLFNLFGKYLEWTPPRIPEISKFIDGIRKKTPLSYIKDIGLTKFVRQKRVFSYAIPSPRIFNFTSFGLVHKSPLKKL